MLYPNGINKYNMIYIYKCSKLPPENISLTSGRVNTWWCKVKRNTLIFIWRHVLSCKSSFATCCSDWQQMPVVRKISLGELIYGCPVTWWDPLGCRQFHQQLQCSLPFEVSNMTAAKPTFLPVLPVSSTFLNYSEKNSFQFLPRYSIIISCAPHQLAVQIHQL